MTLHVVLREYQTTMGVDLDVTEVRHLRAALPWLAVAPSLSGGYDLTPDSHVGVIRIGDTVLEIHPKIGIERLLFLVSFAIDPRYWRQHEVHFAPHESLVEAILPGFLWQVERAFARGVLQGYREINESSSVVRGQARIADQLRRHQGRWIPVEVRFDDFTADIELNRLIKAALYRVRRLPIRSVELRNRIRRLESLLEPVSLLEYQPGRLPPLEFTRLNDHYRQSIMLAKLFLNNISFDIGGGPVAASAFLVDMNQVFEDFVVTGLREALGLSETSFPQGAKGRRLTLDEGSLVLLEPDFSWWEGERCMFAGDVKYKRTGGRGGANADLYQLLGYLTAAGVDEGLLVYAAGDARPSRHVVRNGGKVLEVRMVNLSERPDAILTCIGRIAERLREMRAVNRSLRAIDPPSRSGPVPTTYARNSSLASR